jgi:hypothetical protein
LDAGAGFVYQNYTAKSPPSLSRVRVVAFANRHAARLIVFVRSPAHPSLVVVPCGLSAPPAALRFLVHSFYSAQLSTFLFLTGTQHSIPFSASLPRFSCVDLLQLLKPLGFR